MSSFCDSLQCLLSSKSYIILDTIIKLPSTLTFQYNCDRTQGTHLLPRVKITIDWNPIIMYIHLLVLTT